MFNLHPYFFIAYLFKHIIFFYFEFLERVLLQLSIDDWRIR